MSSNIFATISTPRINFLYSATISFEKKYLFPIHGCHSEKINKVLKRAIEISLLEEKTISTHKSCVFAAIKPTLQELNLTHDDIGFFDNSFKKAFEDIFKHFE
jgi:hypothetical protein